MGSNKLVIQIPPPALAGLKNLLYGRKTFSHNACVW